MEFDNQHLAIDAFIDTVHSGNTARAEAIGQRLAQETIDSGWLGQEFLQGGTLLRFEQIPTSPQDRVEGVAGIEALVDHVPPKRLRELQAEATKGESLTREELAIWRKLAAEGILQENPDGDVYAWWAIRQLTHSDGRIVFFIDLGGGYSFTGPWSEYFGWASSIEDALGQLRSVGFIGVEDLRDRWRPEHGQSVTKRERPVAKSRPTRLPVSEAARRHKAETEKEIVEQLLEVMKGRPEKEAKELANRVVETLAGPPKAKKAKRR